MFKRLNELKIYLIDIDSDFASQLCNEFKLSNESSDKLAKKSAPRPRKQFLVSRALINHILKIDWQSSIQYFLDDSASPPIITPIGKLFLSISHSGKYVAVAIDANPVGVDVETALRDRDYLALAKKSFHEGEIKALECANSPKLLESDFYRIWTLRECFFKLGVLKSLTDQEFDLEKKIGEGVFIPYSYSKDNVYLSVIASYNCTIKLILIDQQPS